MLKLLTAALANDKMQPQLYTPTSTTVGIQLNYVPKGIIIDICQIDLGYSVRLFEMPAGQQQPKAVLKAAGQFLNVGDNEDGTANAEWELCEQIFNKYFGEADQQATADHVAGLLEDKKTKLSVTKNGQ